jgi:hypothetical protein
MSLRFYLRVMIGIFKRNFVSVFRNAAAVGKFRFVLFVLLTSKCLNFHISACRRATKFIRTAKRSAQWALLIYVICKSPRLIVFDRSGSKEKLLRSSWLFLDLKDPILLVLIFVDRTNFGGVPILCFVYFVLHDQLKKFISFWVHLVFNFWRFGNQICLKSLKEGYRGSVFKDFDLVESLRIGKWKLLCFESPLSWTS